jgi:L-ascorbate metabolism protein UlaG (beta-lactamase superfamily)
MKKGIITGILLATLGMSTAWAEEKKPLKIQWFGQSCFLITWPNGTTFLIDPFSPDVGYDMPSPRPDAVLITHPHFDHNYVAMAKGNPQVIRGLTDSKDWNKVSTLVKGVVVKSVGTYHDDQFGAARGKNTAFIMEGDGWRVVHLGDLGHDLGPALVEQFGRVDVLMVPVGGTFTIDAKGADKVVKKLKPKVILPMHYKTDKVSLPIAPVEPFLVGKLGVNKKKGNLLELKELPDEQVIFVLDYK